MSTVHSLTSSKANVRRCPVHLQKCQYPSAFLQTCFTRENYQSTTCATSPVHAGHGSD